MVTYFSNAFLNILLFGECSHWESVDCVASLVALFSFLFSFSFFILLGGGTRQQGRPHSDCSKRTHQGGPPAMPFCLGGGGLPKGQAAGGLGCEQGWSGTVSAQTSFTVLLENQVCSTW